MDIYDNIIRANTSLGDLGTTRQGYVPAAMGFPSGTFAPISQGQIDGNKIVFAASYGSGKAIYCVYDLIRNISEVSMTFGWDSSGSHAYTQTAALIMSASPGLFLKMRHVQCSPNNLIVQGTVNNPANLYTLDNYSIPNSLMDGRLHTLRVKNMAASVEVQLDDIYLQTWGDTNSAMFTGPYVAPEIYTYNSDAYPVAIHDVGANFVM